MSDALREVITTCAGISHDERMQLYAIVDEVECLRVENLKLLAGLGAALDTERERIIDAINFQRPWVRADAAIAVVRGRIGMERRAAR